jgi:hypothetical protein
MCYMDVKCMELGLEQLLAVCKHVSGEEGTKLWNVKRNRYLVRNI